MRNEPLSADECLELAEAIPELPETVIPLHLLRHGLCNAYMKGNLPRFSAAVVQSNSLIEEPFGLGDDHEGLWGLLQHLDGWTCVDVSPAVAPRLGALIREATGKRVYYYGDIYHTLSRPASVLHNDAVRRLTLDDLNLLEGTNKTGGLFGDLRTLLAEGVAAGAVVSDRLVAMAQTSAVAEKLGFEEVSRLTYVIRPDRQDER